VVTYCNWPNSLVLFGLQLFAGHFDTDVGPKVESSSYMNIVKKLDCKSEDVVFLTDVPRGKILKYSNSSWMKIFVPFLRSFA
jgi:methionine salvage enolase-phosphatase E1